MKKQHVKLTSEDRAHLETITSKRKLQNANKKSAIARMLFKNWLVKFKYARFVNDDKTLVTTFAHNAAPAQFLARIGFPIRAITVLQTVKAGSLLQFLTTVILRNNTLAYNIVQAWMDARNLYLISAEEWSRLSKQ